MYVPGGRVTMRKQLLLMWADICPERATSDGIDSVDLSIGRPIAGRSAPVPWLTTCRAQLIAAIAVGTTAVTSRFQNRALVNR